MHNHRAAALLLGMWLAGLIAMTYVAIHNFQQAERLALRPEADAAKILAPLAPGEARMILRHQASELNREYFNAFELAEIGIGVLLTALLMPLAKPAIGWRMMAPAMLVITLAMHFLLTPEITSVGRALDFVDASSAARERAQFWRFHNLYSGLVVLKLAMASALIGRLLLQRSRHEREMDSRRQVNRVNHRDYREVNG